MLEPTEYRVQSSGGLPREVDGGPAVNKQTMQVANGETQKKLPM